MVGSGLERKDQLELELEILDVVHHKGGSGRACLSIGIPTGSR